MSPLSRSSHALVTGGGRGIGLCDIAAALSKAGATVTVLGRNRATLDEAVASGAAQFAAVADVADQASVKSAVAEAAARQPIDILDCQCGRGGIRRRSAASDAALFQRMMDVNFMGVVHATQAVLPGMVERRHGRIVAVASTAGLKGYAYVSAYSAAKHAVIGLVRSLALETAKSGVTVNAVCPGFTETDLLEGSIDNIMQEDRPQPRAGHRGTVEAQSARTPRGAVGSGRCRALALRRRRRRHHRTGHRGCRRRSLIGRHHR